MFTVVGKGARGAGMRNREWLVFFFFFLVVRGLRRKGAGGGGGIRGSVDACLLASVGVYGGDEWWLWQCWCWCSCRCCG